MKPAVLLLLGFCVVYPELVEGSHSCTFSNSIVHLDCFSLPSNN